jgi:hypothetical protein
MVTEVLSTNRFTSYSKSKIIAVFVIIMCNNPEGSMRQVLETFINGSRKDKLKLRFHKMSLKVFKLELSEVIFMHRDVIHMYNDVILHINVYL